MTYSTYHYIISVNQLIPPDLTDDKSTNHNISMRGVDRKKLKDWAIAYAKNPNTNPSSSPSQALAIKIHNLMSDGKWRTSTAIATELSESVYSVRTVLCYIKDDWHYETSKSRTKGGYRRGNSNT